MKKNLLLMVVSCCLACSIGKAEALRYEWASVFGGGLVDYGGTIKENAQGDLFILGSFQSSQDNSETPENEFSFNGVTITGAATEKANTNVFFYKMDKNGQAIWGVHSDLGNFSILNNSAMVPTADGGACLALKVKKSVNVTNGDAFVRLTDGANQIIEIPADDISGDVTNNPNIGLIVRLDKDGKVLWTKQIGIKQATDKDVLNCLAMAEDQDGHLYIGGKFKSTITFEPSTELTAKGAANTLYLVKLDNNGNYASHFTSGGNTASEEEINNINVAGASLYIAGTMKGNTSAIEFGNVQVTPSSGTDVFVASLNSDDFSVSWVKQIEASTGGTSKLLSMFVEDNSIYAAGWFTKSVSAGDLSITGTTTYSQGLLVKLSAINGNIDYMKGALGAYALLGSVHKVDNTLCCAGVYSNGWNINSTDLIDFDLGNGVTLSKDAVGSVNNQGDFFVVSYESATGNALSAENVVQGDGMETFGGSALIDNQLVLIGHTQYKDSPVKINSLEFNRISSFDIVLASFSFSDNSGIQGQDINSSIYAYVENNRLVVFCDNQEIANVTLYNSMGTVIEQIRADNHSNKIELATSVVNKGIYLIRVETLSGICHTIKVKL